MFVVFFFFASASVGFAEECDPLVPDHCMLPFPNDFWRTSNKLNFSQNTFPLDGKGVNIDPVVGGWNELDGFSPIPTILAFWPNMTDSSISNVASWKDMSKSLSSDSPTLLIDTSTGTLVPHWGELDSRSGATEQDRALILYPSSRLKDATRYIVALRGIRNSEGLVSTSPAFAALRDNTTDPAVEHRRKHFETIFASLAKAGVQRSSLQLAWDFTTNSRESLNGRMLAARDDALKRVNDAGPAYTINKVTHNVSAEIAVQIEGTMNVPFYLNRHCLGYIDLCNDVRLVLDEAGKPVYQGLQKYTWIAMVPHSLTQPGAKPGTILQYGHGLFGDKKEITYGSESGLREDANKYGWVLAACDWIGLAARDESGLAAMLATNMTNFPMLPDQTTQGVINSLMLMRLLKGRLHTDPNFVFNGKSAIDPSKTYYNGNSQGGILGGVYMAVTTDVQRGSLGVGGAPYALLLPRSADFSALFDVISLRYKNTVDRICLFAVLQLLWDRADPSAYLHAISSDPFPDTPTHHVMMHSGLGDAQVSWLANHMFSRSVGAKIFESNVHYPDEVLFGFDRIADNSSVPIGSNLMVQFDFGVPEVPFGNVPPSKAGDTHECSRRNAECRLMMEAFMRTGQTTNACKGPCKFTFPCK